MYFGCSNEKPLYGVELDPKNNFSEIGIPTPLLYAKATKHGWERRGDDNLLDEQPWIEGAWMTKHKGKYFLQYSGPGTEFNSYADGVYISDNALGPFVYNLGNPVSFKPTGFITGGGHGCTLTDKYGKTWRVVTMVISVKHMFERRIGIFPASFDKDTMLYVNTVFGDYPQYLPVKMKIQVIQIFPDGCSSLTIVKLMPHQT
jgi:xylan 1,4-beta-xylosidase